MKDILLLLMILEFLNDNIHKTAIDYARENKNFDIVDLLNREKAKTKKPNANAFSSSSR